MVKFSNIFSPAIFVILNEFSNCPYISEYPAVIYLFKVNNQNAKVRKYPK